MLTTGDAALGDTLNAVTLTGGYSEFNLHNNSPGDTTIGNDVQVTGTGLTLLNPLGTAPANSVVNMGRLSIGAGQELGVYLAAAPAACGCVSKCISQRHGKVFAENAGLRGHNGRGLAIWR